MPGNWHWHEGAQPPAAPPDVAAIEAALAEGKPLCRQCFNMYVPHPWPRGAMFECRSILMLPDCEPDPMLCDACFGAIVSSFNRQATNVGTSNASATNLALAQLG